MKNKIQFLFRTLFTLGLLYGVYTETGPFTAFNLFLIWLAIEGIALILKKFKETP